MTYSDWGLRIHEYPAGRIPREAKLYKMGAGTNEIHRLLIVRELFTGTGEHASASAPLPPAGEGLG